jgi:dihydroorotate dehydrogenase
MRPNLYVRLRPLLFRLDAETAHLWTLDLLRLCGASAAGRALLRSVAAPPRVTRPVQVPGLQFPNQIGLAAGYDKDGRSLRGLACLGFGHVEVGTVTREPQAGHPRPRVFRLLQDQALINRMGFPSRGEDAVGREIGRGRPPGVVLGINLGKSTATPLEAAADDYCGLVQALGPLADYLTINVSSPNTLGLRRLQARDYLEVLLGRIAEARKDLLGRHRPLLVKLSPDLDPQELEDALGAVASSGVEGVVATNTTTARPGLLSPQASRAGGLSGGPLFPLALDQVRRAAKWGGGRIVIVACGGVSDRHQMLAMLDAGASLVQVFTALVYRGPGLVRELIGGP